ncbi:MAG: LacI family DNA-binding transcriptional regulator [Bacteroidota bacterium]
MIPTIKQVALEAGVSVATVSRVMNDSGPVRESTRQRILEVARALNYVPNSAARSLIMARTSTLGILLPDLYGEFFSEVIRGIDTTAQEHGYHILVSGAHSDEEEIEATLKVMHGRVDGLIVMAPDTRVRSLRQNLPYRLPVVLLNCEVDGHPFPLVNIDNRAGARSMVRHLRSLGHRRIAVVSGGPDNYDSKERLAGYREVMEEGGSYNPAYEFEGDFSEASGYRLARRIMEQEPPPTAIFAFNDSMAIGVMSALQEAGIRIPDYVSVAGFDDIPMSRYLTPPLSSVHVPISDLGARAMSCLIDSVHQRSCLEPVRQTLPTRLVLRRSTGPVPS